MTKEESLATADEIKTMFHASGKQKHAWIARWGARSGEEMSWTVTIGPYKL